MLDKVPILLAEDDRKDAALMVEAFARAAISNPLMVVQSGHEAINYLSGLGAFSERTKYPLPGLLLLDLKMPWMDGFDVLAWLRRHDEFNTLPVVVLTALRLEGVASDQRLRGACDYRVKPVGLAELVRLVEDVKKCWLDERFNRIGALPLSSAVTALPALQPKP